MSIEAIKPLAGKDIATLTHAELVTEISRLVTEIDRLQRENAALKIDASNHAADAETVRREREVERRRAEAAEAEVKRLQTELALSKPLYCRRQIEARVKLLEAALKPFRTVSKDWVDETGWTDVACQNDRIVDWFGPSDFLALASTGGEHYADK